MTHPDPIEIFRPGRFTSVEGVVVNLTLADLEATAAAYDAVNEPAPLVKGHPQLDHPAYGWVGAMTVVDGKLLAHPTDVVPAFAEEVRAKRYRRISPSFYPPAHAANPRPGVWYPKHIGFLGAAAPAVRGLKPVHFSEAQLAGAVTIDFTPETTMTDTPDTPDPTVAFAEREAAIATLEADLAQRQADVAAREAAIVQADREAVHTANVSFAEGLIAGGRLAPAGKDKLVGLLDVLSAATVVSFAEAEGHESPIATFKGMLETASPIVSFGEAAPADDAQLSVVSFAAPSGFTVDQTSLDLHAKALAHQATHKGVGYIDAVKAVS